MRWFIQYWQGTETILGSDGISMADGRLNRGNVLSLARLRARKGATHFSIYKSNRLSMTDDVTKRIEIGVTNEKSN